MEKARSYTGLFIIVPEKQDEIGEVKNGISLVIGENTGKIVKENMIGKRKLAYPIKKKNDGVYYEVTFTALPKSVTKMRKLFQINTDILRTLIDKS
ncbi:MAG: 30S ribosomal protein S6 [Candidatus Omnitrophota bacterium]|nr:30S ribosomal protein S6 [Candidatus Omnitrophota bacterium]MBU1894367.1 30S ribosomal protein S6 [Candidatus Omnitrophota bacterium]